MFTKFLLASALLALASSEYVSYEFCLPLPIRWGDYYPTWKIFKPNSTITYKCANDYEMVGHATAKCLGTYWDYPYPKCIKTVKCKRPHQPGYGYITPHTGYSYKVGVKITYHCNDGYDLEGQNIHTCLSNGYWNYPPPKCLTYKCHPPSKYYEYVTYSPQKSIYYAGDVIYFSCKDDYTLHGHNSATCLKGGYWTPHSPKCNKYCSPPDLIENGYYKPRRSSYTPGEYVTYSCYGNRKIRGYRVIRCDEYGQWPKDLPVCGDPICPRPKRPEGGFYHPSQPYYYPGSMVHFSCGTHSIEGPKYITCHPGGYWSGYVPKCVVPFCPKPKFPKNGYFGPIQEKYKNDEGIWFKCKLPFILKGQKDIHCIKGKWSHPEPICVLPQCPRPRDIQYGGYRVYNYHYPQGYKPNQLYPIGMRIEYFCHSPYALKGPAVHTCKQGGSWSHHPPTCVHGCKQPDIGYIGYITPEKPQYAPGEQVWIKCPPGYRVKPESDIVCLGHHNWSQNHVRCVTEGSCKGRCNELHHGNSCHCDATLCNKDPYLCCSDYHELCLKSIPYFR